MEFLPSGISGFGRDPGAADPRNGNLTEEVPQLDHDSSTVPSSSPSTTSSKSVAPVQSTLNPQASWFDFNGLPAENDMLFPNSDNLPPYEQPFRCGTTTNEDIKWMVIGMASRLDALELAVSTGNMRIGHVQDGVTEILKRSQTAEDMVREIDNLKKSLKELIKSFVLLSFGGEGIEDNEMQLSRAE
ncbi:hypothetical protein HRG_012522 [Hirsutella rhossiliensis]